MRKHKKGFTIVELVIVIGVIGILSAILIPTFVNVTDNANKAALKSNLANAYSMYAADAVDPENDIPFKAQKDVWLSKDSDPATQGHTNLGYKYDSDQNGWQTTGVTLPTGYTLVENKEYNGYYVFAAQNA